MEKLPKDMVNKVIDELSPQDFINFCVSKTSPNVTRICNMSELWERRLRKDFPYIVEKFPKILEFPKKLYLYIFRSISKLAETFTEIVLQEYGEMRRFLTSDFKPFLYNLFYELCVAAIRNVLKEEDYEDEDWISDSVMETYYDHSVVLFNYFPGTKEIDYLYEFRDKWDGEILFPLRSFIKEIIELLKEYK